jgi:hypothetical protein
MLTNRPKKPTGFMGQAGFHPGPRPVQVVRTTGSGCLAFGRYKDVYISPSR